MRFTRILLTTVLLIVTARLVLLFGAYVLGASGVQRHHVESTGTAFVALALLLGYTLSGRAEFGVQSVSRSSRLLWPAYCALAVALYWPALFVGLLSDDYVLFQRAAALDVSAVSSTLFRPVPLAAWALIVQTGGGPVLLHLLNALLHGTNAYLSSVAIGEWVSAKWSVFGGLLVVAAPLAPEAVAWCSGVFDLSATSLVLGAIVIARRYAAGTPPAWVRLALIVLSLGAVLCKETAAIGPLLVLLSAWMGGRIRRALLIDLAAVIVAIGLYGGLRLAANPEPSLFAVSKYGIQRALFGAFGSLAVPFHVDVLAAARWIPVLAVTLSLAIWTIFSTTRGSRRRLGLTAAGLAWVLISILPVWPILVVPGDLQASRFLYLAATGWTAVLLVPASSIADRFPRFAFAPAMAIAILVAISGAATRIHLRPWQEAGHLRDRVLQAAAVNPQMRECANVAVSDAPDSVRGAYVFRNGLAESFRMTLGMIEVGSPSDAQCRFRWTAEGTFVTGPERAAPLSSR